MHYARVRKHGDPHESGRYDNFTRYLVDDETGCWMWTGCDDGKGYGFFSVRYEGEHRAHRAFYTKFVGPIPKGMELDHLCNRRSCVNPDHLEPVTHDENMRRARRGTERNPRCMSGRHDVTKPGSWITFPSRPHLRQCVECYRLSSRRNVTATA